MNSGFDRIQNTRKINFRFALEQVLYVLDFYFWYSVCAQNSLCRKCYLTFRAQLLEAWLALTSV